MDASPKEKFEAAVKVIQTLPRNVSIRDVIRLSQGAFQPSNNLMLRFYGYYKQATSGPCDVARPAFYDVVGKAKWDAWDKLGNMSPEEAMDGYVDELKNIIEAMPHTAMVQDFVSKLGDFYELVDEVRGQEYRRIKPALHLNGDVGMKSSGSASSSPAKSSDTDSSSGTTELMSHQEDEANDTTETEADKVLQMNGHVVKDTELPLGSRVLTKPGSGSDDDSDNEEFCDTVDASPPQYVRGDYTYSPGSLAAAPILPSAPVLPRDLSTASLGLGPHQLSDRNWSRADLLSMEEEEDGDVLMMRGGGQVDDNEGTGGVTFPRTDSGTSFASQGRGGPSGDDSRRSHLMTGSGSGGGGQGQRSGGSGSDVSVQLSVALTRLQEDMNTVMSRLSTLETLTQAQQRERTRGQNHDRNRVQRRQPWWWPFGGLSGKTIFFLVVWPFIINWFLSRRRRRTHTH